MLEIKTLGVEIYVQILSVGKTGKILSEFHLVFKLAIQRIKKFEGKLPILAEKKQRDVVAIDETAVKSNGERNRRSRAV